MKITVDTSHDTHDDIKKVIRMLQNLVGDSGEIFTNQPQSQETVSPIANIFGDAASTPSISPEPEQTPPPVPEAEPAEQSTEDLFAELFSEEELKKMDSTSVKEEDEEPKQKKKKYDLEFY